MRAREVGLAIGLVVLGDFLLAHSWPGWTLGAFGCALLVAMTATWPRLLRRPAGWAFLLLDFGLCFALVNDPTPLALALLGAGLVGYAVADQVQSTTWGVAASCARALCWFPLSAAAGAAEDLSRISIQHVSHPRLGATVHTWALPVIGGALFLALFSGANPIIGTLIDTGLRTAMEVFNIGPAPSVDRVLFWIVLAAIAWSLLRPVMPPPTHDLTVAAPSNARSGRVAPSTLVSPAALLRALLVFNALFALQNTLDFVYIGTGRTLPDGFTFATYAHRGTYLLVVTALLAAVFVLAAFRADNRHEQTRTLRLLMYVWIAQNVLLMAFSIRRTQLYVEVYSLTHLRLAAFIWMGLVAIGLGLIAIRVARDASTAWLIDSNAVVLLVVLYGCCFVDFSGFIARFNVEHSAELTGRGVGVDYRHLASLGPHALPALDRLLADPLSQPARAAALRRHLQARLDNQLADWRSWTWHASRIIPSAQP